MVYRNRPLYKIIATQAEKEYLMRQNVMPFSHRSRQIAFVTARSMFRQFGAGLLSTEGVSATTTGKRKLEIKGLPQKTLRECKGPVLQKRDKLPLGKVVHLLHWHYTTTTISFTITLDPLKLCCNRAHVLQEKPLPYLNIHFGANQTCETYAEGSTLDKINNLGIPYKAHGRLAEAEQTYQGALQGYNKDLCVDNAMKYIPTLNQIHIWLQCS